MKRNQIYWKRVFLATVSMILVSLSCSGCCQTSNGCSEYRTVPVTNNPHNLPKGSSTSGIPY